MAVCVNKTLHTRLKLCGYIHTNWILVLAKNESVSVRFVAMELTERNERENIIFFPFSLNLAVKLTINYL